MNPNVHIITRYLRSQMTKWDGYCRDNNGRCEPAEIFLSGLECWVRADGSGTTYSRSRGSEQYDWFERWYIRRAVRAWERSARL